jgi:hypothetical protein
MEIKKRSIPLSVSIKEIVMDAESSKEGEKSFEKLFIEVEQRVLKTHPLDDRVQAVHEAADLVYRVCKILFYFKRILTRFC